MTIRRLSSTEIDKLLDEIVTEEFVQNAFKEVGITVNGITNKTIKNLEQAILLELQRENVRLSPAAFAAIHSALVEAADEVNGLQQDLELLRQELYWRDAEWVDTMVNYANCELFVEEDDF